MEESLTDASRSGNIDALYGLIKQDPYLLEKIDQIPFVNTPLHIASSYPCSTHFAIEVLSLKPSFGRKLNSDGLSPLDLALRFKQTQTVHRLVDHAPELIRVKGKARFTPLHYVAEVDDGILLDKFLLRCPKSIEDLTIGRESAVHVAVTNRSLRALEVLLEWLRLTQNEQILNWEDEIGNTVLHIAAATNNYEAVNMLIKKVDVNSKNLKGMKAVHLASDQRIIDVLRGQELSWQNLKTQESNFARFGEFLLGAPGKGAIPTTVGRTHAAHLVTSALIITTTYHALLDPPDFHAKPSFGDASPSSDDGTWFRNACKIMFFSGNTLAFLSSMLMISSLLHQTNNSRLLKVSWNFLFFSYLAAFQFTAPGAYALLYPFMLVVAGIGYLLYFRKHRKV